MPLLRDIVDQLKNQQLNYFTNQVLNAIGLFFIMKGSAYAQTYVFNNIGNRILLDIRMQVYEKLHTLSQSFFLLEHPEILSLECLMIRNV